MAACKVTSPLLKAVEENAPVNVVKGILESNPMLMEIGRPIHLAMMKKCSVEVIDLLMETWPKVVRESNLLATRTPLHMALYEDSPAE